MGKGGVMAEVGYNIEEKEFECRSEIRNCTKKYNKNSFYV